MKDLRKVLLLTFMSACCIALAACATEAEVEVVPAPPVMYSVFDETSAPPVTTPPPPVPKYHLEWLEVNEDVVGYVEIEGTKISYPVLQGPDNDYYMDNDINHNKCLTKACITADFRTQLDGYRLSDNTRLYGHNPAQGTFFAQLTRYYMTTEDGSLSFYKANPIVKFDTLYEQMEWKIFAVVLFNTQPNYGDVMRFWDYGDFATADEFHEFIFGIMDRSVLFTDVDLEFGDKILTLSTCYYPYGKSVDTRAVVFARKIREGESREVDVDKAKRNRQAMRFTEEAKRIGTMWTGERVWDTSYLKSYTPSKMSTKKEPN